MTTMTNANAHAARSQSLVAPTLTFGFWLAGVVWLVMHIGLRVF
jgi:hypothetical protein